MIQFFNYGIIQKLDAKTSTTITVNDMPFAIQVNSVDRSSTCKSSAINICVEVDLFSFSWSEECVIKVISQNSVFVDSKVPHDWPPLSPIPRPPFCARR